MCLAVFVSMRAVTNLVHSKWSVKFLDEWMNIVMIFSCFLSSHTVYFWGNFAMLLEGLERKPGLEVPKVCSSSPLLQNTSPRCSVVEREVTNLLSLLISVGQDFGQLACIILVFISHS